MPYNWSFYHPGPIEGEEGGKWSMINVYGLTFLKNGVLKSNLLASQTKKIEDFWVHISMRKSFYCACLNFVTYNYYY